MGDNIDDLEATAAASERIAASHARTLGTLNANVAKLAALADTGSDALPAIQAELAVLVAQARTAAVALNGTGLVALAALAATERTDIPPLGLPVQLMFSGLVMGLMAWLLRLLFHTSQVELLRSLPLLRDRAEELERRYRLASPDRQFDDPYLVAEVGRMVRRERFIFFVAVVLAESLTYCRRLEGFGLAASIVLFIAAVAIPIAAFTAG